MRSIDGWMCLYANGNKWPFDENNSGWYRAVIRMWPVREGEPAAEGLTPGNPVQTAFHRELYINGVPIKDDVRDDNTYFRAAFVTDAKIWFLSESDDELETESENFPMPCSTIAVWNRLLDPEEILQLGGVSK
jgi:hypothetical protein